VSEQHPFDDAQRAELRQLLLDRSLIQGDVTLSSGQSSSFYFDCKRVTMYPRGASLVADACLAAIARLPERPQAVGGMTSGADPMVGAVMMRALERGWELASFYVRKEPKKHGTRQWLENAPDKGTKVVMVEDVVTSGGSVIRAIERAEEAGLIVVSVITLVDRGAGGAAAVGARCAAYHALYQRADFPELA